MVLNKKAQFNIQNNLEFMGNNCLKVNTYKDFFFKRNNYNMFKKDGKFNIQKKEISIFRYLKHLSHSKKKWNNYHFKKRYLLRKRYKKQHLRIKNYIQKNVIHQKFEYQYQINKLFFETCIQQKFNNNYIYDLDIFELLKFKSRIILKLLKKA